MIRNKKIFHFANNDYDGAGIQVLNNHKYLIKNNFASKVFLIDKKNTQKALFALHKEFKLHKKK